jgi:phosphoglucomutase
MQETDYDSILEHARAGIDRYLQESLDNDEIDRQLFDDARAYTFPNLKKWLLFPDIAGVSNDYKKGIVKNVTDGNWKDIVNAYRQPVRFGTGGIRGMMAFDKKSIVRLQTEGVGASILKGPNTINDIVISLTTAGVAKFGKAQTPQLEKVVVGYDSRIRGFDFAHVVARVFLGYGYTVYFFDAPCPYPEVTFAIPFGSSEESVKADIGVLISASHNDYRYNGYKLSCSNGSQFDPEERDEMYNEYIATATVEDIKILEFGDAPPDKLIFLGGREAVDKETFDYTGRLGPDIDMHKLHREHVEKFLLTIDLKEQQESDKARALQIAFCPFHGVGIEAVPRLLTDVGFPRENVRSIDGTDRGRGLNQLNGLFPAFCSDPGKEQQPDPGDPRAAEIAVTAFKEDYESKFDEIDIVIGTDPDADRCGIVVKVPENQRHIYNNNRDYYLLPADDMWTLVLWYRLFKSQDKNARVRDAARKFVVLSHTTSDSITFLAKKNGLGVVKTWVGFAALAAATRDVWNGRVDELLELVEGRDKKWTELCHPFVCQCRDMNDARSINVAAMEQSNGFSILGGPPPDTRSLGIDGHVRDKDGTFAALLVADIAAWAKTEGTTIMELLDNHIYLDPDIGLFATFYEPDPLDGEYPGIKGDRIKKDILVRALNFHEAALAGSFELGGLPVKGSVIYRTGKYDNIYPPSQDFQFPDEGIRFFFDDKKLQHVTVRPSGTGNSLRFHIQLHALPTEANLIQKKKELKDRAGVIMDDLRLKLGAPRAR